MSERYTYPYTNKRIALLLSGLALSISVASCGSEDAKKESTPVTSESSDGPARDYQRDLSDWIENKILDDREERQI